MTPPDAADLARRVRRTALACAGVVAGMVGARLRLRAALRPVLPRHRLRRHADRRHGRRRRASLDRDHRGALRRQRRAGPRLALRAGDGRGRGQGSARPRPCFYRVRNDGADRLDRASRPSTSSRAWPAAYFVKLAVLLLHRADACSPARRMDSAVVFYVDPALADDPNVRDLKSHHPVLHLLPGQGRGSRSRRRAAEAVTD